MPHKKQIPVFFPSGSLNDIGPDPIIADPFGSYTGLVEDLDDKPIQDADDL